MTEKIPLKAFESKEPAPDQETPSPKPSVDMIDQSLRALFQGAETEPLPDSIAQLLKRMAEESPK